MLKKVLALLLACSLLCGVCFAEDTASSVPDFRGMSDPTLLPYLEDTFYQELVTTLNSSDYFVENVSAVYISQEYLDELAFNSQANIFFGYTLAELDEQFQGTRYIFTLGENNETIIKPFEAFDDTYQRVLSNVAVGSGVILICVTVSAVTAGVGAPAVSMIMAAAAKSGALMALSGSALGAASAGMITGIQSGDINAALKSAALAGSEGFKWGAISGALSGGVSTGIALKGATLKGLSMNEAALIQRNSGYPLDVIKNFKSMEQYNICKEAGLTPRMINGRTSLIRSIDLDCVDEFGRSNLQRMKEGLAALDPTGQSYELHHIGQEMNSTLAILTKAEHMQKGNNLIWHELGSESAINRTIFNKQRIAFWKEVAAILVEGGI